MRLSKLLSPPLSLWVTSQLCHSNVSRPNSALGRGGIRDPVPRCVALANLRPLGHRGSHSGFNISLFLYNMKVCNIYYSLFHSRIIMDTQTSHIFTTYLQIELQCPFHFALLQWKQMVIIISDGYSSGFVCALKAPQYYRVCAGFMVKTGVQSDWLISFHIIECVVWKDTYFCSTSYSKWIPQWWWWL